MKLNPQICTEGPKKGDIDWLPRLNDGNKWVDFADFEREKLRKLGREGEVAHISTSRYEGGYGNCAAYTIFFKPKNERGDDPAEYDSGSLIGYPNRLYFKDSESSRLLKRAEFLKAVCEKVGIEWLPKERCDRHPFFSPPKCDCDERLMNQGPATPHWECPHYPCPGEKTKKLTDSMLLDDLCDLLKTILPAQPGWKENLDCIRAFQKKWKEAIETQDKEDAQWKECVEGILVYLSYAVPSGPATEEAMDKINILFARHKPKEQANRPDLF